MIEQMFKGNRFNEIEEIVKEIGVKTIIERKDTNIKFASYDFMGDIINISYRSPEDVTRFVFVKYSKNVSGNASYQVGLEKLMEKLESLK